MRRVMAMATTILVGMLAFAAAPPAAAEDSSSLSVTSVAGRDVQLLLRLDPTMQVAADTPTRATVEVQGVVIPATTDLEVIDTRPTTAFLVLDASGSMAGARIKDARTAATAFLESIPPDVKVGLVTFNDSVAVRSEPTLDRETIISAIESTKPNGDTSLYDAVDTALAQVPEGSRARLLVLSDGKDTASGATLARVERVAAKSGVPIDVVALKPTKTESRVLQGIADVNNGTLRTAAESTDLVTEFTAASQSFGATVTLDASIPEGVDASGQPIAATVSVGGTVIEETTTLPAEPSLAGSSATPVPTVAPTQTQVVPQPLPVAAPPAPSNHLVPLLLAILIFVALVFIALAILNARHHTKVVDRVEQVLSYETGSRTSTWGRAPRLTALASFDAFLARHMNVAKVQRQLSAAEFGFTPAGWLLLRFAAGFVACLVLALMFNNLLLGIILGALLTWLVARTILRSRVASRQRAFADELSDFLLLLASGLRAGLSFTHSLASAAEDDKGEVGRQMRRVLREVNVGASLDSALLECAHRMDNEDLRWLVTALSIQREVGGNLSNILDTVAATIKGRDDLRREVRTLSAEGRLSGYILIALPVGVFLFLVAFRRPYVELLWTSPLGLVMLLGLVILMTIGWFWMRRVVRINV